MILDYFDSKLDGDSWEVIKERKYNGYCLYSL